VGQKVCLLAGSIQHLLLNAVSFYLSKKISSVCRTDHGLFETSAIYFMPGHQCEFKKLIFIQPTYSF
jgi:uncharacterized membrane protein